MSLTFQPTRFQRAVLDLLVLTALLWLLLLTGFKEYWGFWQSPEVYGFLKHEYPQWFRDYIQSFYSQILWSTVILVIFVSWQNAVELRRLSERRAAFYWRLSILLLHVFLFGLVMGVRSSNNWIGWLDRGHLHGITPMQVRE